MSMASNSMLFDKAKKLEISKPDLNNNTSIFKANEKVFKSVSTLSNYIKIFEFDPNYLIV